MWVRPVAINFPKFTCGDEMQEKQFLFTTKFYNYVKWNSECSLDATKNFDI